MTRHSPTALSLAALPLTKSLISAFGSLSSFSASSSVAEDRKWCVQWRNQAVWAEVTACTCRASFTFVGTLTTHPSSLSRLPLCERRARLFVNSSENKMTLTMYNRPVTSLTCKVLFPKGNLTNVNLLNDEKGEKEISTFRGGCKHLY